VIKLRNLIVNENMKLYRRLRTWVMVGLMIGLVLLSSILEWHYDGKENSGDNWRVQLEEERKMFDARMKQVDQGEENKAYFKEQIDMIDYHLEKDIRPPDGTMWDGINGSAELIIVITLFTVIVAGDSLAGEFSSGTIKLLLIRPSSRLKILLSKYLSMILFGLGLLVVLFIVSVLVNGILYQFGSIDLPLITTNEDGQVVEQNMVANLWKTYLLNVISTIMFVTMAFMISAAFRSSAMAIGFSIFALFSGHMLLEVLQRYEWSKYLLFANTDLSQYLSGAPFQEGMTLAFSITVLLVYFVIFNLVSWLVFTQRDVAA
jgi:ABC-2 type transport system permease protein